MINPFTKGRLKDIVGLALVVTLLQVALFKLIIPFLNLIIPGYLPALFNVSDLKSWVILFIGVFVILSVGYYIYDQRWAWKGKNIYQRLWAILLYGTLVFYVFLLLTNMDIVSSIFSSALIWVGINYFILAFIISLLARKFNFLRI